MGVMGVMVRAGIGEVGAQARLVDAADSNSHPHATGNWRISGPWRPDGRIKMSDPRAIFEQTSKTTGHPNEFRFE
jgi:hypothetical protein